MAADPDLSEAGRARAASLATALKDAGIVAIFTTEFKRTQQTAEPLAKALGLTVKVVKGDAEAPGRTGCRRQGQRPRRRSFEYGAFGREAAWRHDGCGCRRRRVRQPVHRDARRRALAASPSLSMMRVLEPSRRLALVVAALALASPLRGPAFDPAGSVAPQELARFWDAEHVSPPLPPLLDHAEVERRLEAVAERDPDRCSPSRRSASRSKGARSTRSRPAPARSACCCGRRCTATSRPRPSALFDVFEYLQRHRHEPAVQRMLSSLTLHVVPMLNPDGAERFQRRNAQGIDINRDALRLQTPEGQLLKALRDRFNPRVGFNLHNQGWSTSVGDPPKPASISLLSVAYDEPRIRERRAAS